MVARASWLEQVVCWTGTLVGVGLAVAWLAWPHSYARDCTPPRAAATQVVYRLEVNGSGAAAPVRTPAAGDQSGVDPVSNPVDGDGAVADGSE